LEAINSALLKLTPQVSSSTSAPTISPAVLQLAAAEARILVHGPAFRVHVNQKFWLDPTVSDAQKNVWIAGLLKDYKSDDMYKYAAWCWVLANMHFFC
jgi:hypothetical protein